MMFDFKQLLLDKDLAYVILGDGDRVLNNMMDNIVKMHPYAITPPKKEGGRWQTSFKGEDGIRRNIKASTKAKLLQKLLEAYSEESKKNRLIFHDLFDQWIEYKTPMTNSEDTIERHIQRYNKYFLNSPLDQMAVEDIDDMTLEQLCNAIVKDNNLSGTEWRNAKTILIGMFEYAYRKRYISTNPVPHIKILVKFRQVTKKSGKSQTYNTEELEDLFQYLEAEYAETADDVYLCVRFNFELGLRVGELVALKWEDIDDDFLHITRQEVRHRKENRYEVVAHTKTRTERDVVLTDNAKEILGRIQPDSEYIFTRNGKRLTSRQINYVLEKYAKSRGRQVKSSHKIRKTYASRLSAYNVPIDCIREMLGHADLKTTYSYIYNPLAERETINLVNNALKCLPVSTKS